MYGLNRGSSALTQVKVDQLWNEGGQSGSKDDLGNRPKLLEILTQIEQGVIKHLYVWNTDRLSRKQPKVFSTHVC